RVVEGTGLENRRSERVLEFESLRFHQHFSPSLEISWGFFVSVVYHSRLTPSSSTRHPPALFKSSAKLIT
ncbi:hypothetical protein LVQ79_21025, partial [Buttiauxella sp. A2-C1_F]|uniref:hypothetical protein n=1 Tax=Buttiauxella sp. A2-C1_F TaxID=2904526 RepID=UPI001E4F3F8E